MYGFGQRPSSGTLVQLLLALLLAAGAYWIIDKVALSAIGAISVDIASDQNTVTQIYYDAKRNGQNFSEKHASETVPLRAGKMQQLRFKFNNARIGTIRLDPGNRKGTYRLYQIVPQSFFGDIPPIKPFTPDCRLIAGPGTHLIKHDDFLEIRADNDDPWVIIQTPVKADGYIYPFFAALLTFLAVISTRLSFDARKLIFWQDTLAKKPSFGKNYAALDGLRGFAALLVLASHVGLPGFARLGPVGVVIFFCLSGFLLSIPFAHDPARVVSRPYLEAFFVRRFKRIVPMYYTVITASYLFHDRLEDFLRSAFFIQGQSILWAVSQEVHFYLLFPLIMLINYACFRRFKILQIGWLLALGFCFNHKILHTYPIYGQGNHLHILAGIFLSGICVGYLLQIEAVRNSRMLHAVCRNPLTGILILAAIPGSASVWAIFHDGQLPAMSWVYYGNYNYVIAVLLLCLTLVEKSLLVSFFSWLPLRLIGTVSYSFYLLHPTCLKVAKQLVQVLFHHSLTPTPMFFLTFFITSLASIFTYTYIERVFIRPTATS